MSKASTSEIFERPPKGVPVAIPITVIARDEQQQTATLEHVVVMEVSDKPATQPAPAVQVVKPPRDRPAVRGNPDNSEAARLQQKLDALEAENQRLKNQMRESSKRSATTKATTRP